MLWLRHNKKIKSVLNFHDFNFIPRRKRIKEEIVVSFFLLFFLLSHFLVLSFLPAWLPPCLSPFFQERPLLLQILDEFWSLYVQFQLDTNCSLCFIVYISFLFCFGEIILSIKSFKKMNMWLRDFIWFSGFTLSTTASKFKIILKCQN